LITRPDSFSRMIQVLDTTMASSSAAAPTAIAAG
jgi:hypothetical protein